MFGQLKLPNCFSINLHVALHQLLLLVLKNHDYPKIVIDGRFEKVFRNRGQYRWSIVQIARQGKSLTASSLLPALLRDHQHIALKQWRDQSRY